MTSTPSLLIRRLFAMMIDYAILAFSLLLFFYVGLSDVNLNLSVDRNHLTMALFVILAPLIIGNLFFLEGSALKGSIGKIVMQLEVVSVKENKQLNFFESFVRNLLKIISLQVFFFVGFVVFFTKKNQALHDMLFDTIVRDRKSDPADIAISPLDNV